MRLCAIKNPYLNMSIRKTVEKYLTDIMQMIYMTIWYADCLRIAYTNMMRMKFIFQKGANLIEPLLYEQHWNLPEGDFKLNGISKVEHK